MRSAEEQMALRNAAMEWLAARTNDGLDPIDYEDLREFTFHGEKQALRNRQLGIYKPQGMRAALSITTAFRPSGADRPYDDSPGPDGLLRYKWQGDDPEHWNNRALRAAMEEQAPLIWFWGVAPGVYKPIFPVFLVDEEPEHQQFVVATDRLQNFEAAGAANDEVFRRYMFQQTRRRVHQPVFRAMVMRAYEASCAVCQLRHSPLLDAAHIVEDRHELGIAAVRNGLALCKIHHAAYDAGILGVTPDLHVEIRDDILEEIDGPVLEYGLKRLHGLPLKVIPKAKSERPDTALLTLHYEKFMSTRSLPRGRYDLARPSFRTELRD
ncbi:HNH endonuclease [Brachybacterium huguangmaarense]